MILDIFSELQKAKPWGPNHERQMFLDNIEQAKLADAQGFGCWWTVEHHGGGEFSHSSSPEMVLAVISQHTERIHLGHSGVLAPFEINHPIRVAERAAFLDIISGGRLELGLARSGGKEWDAFQVDPETSRDQLREALHMVPRMWTQKSFKWESDLATIPERNIVPKPLQKPHPPLWQTATSPESFQMAGNLGVGVLGTTMLSPLSTLGELIQEYNRGLEHCQPAGEFVNAQRSIFTFMHCAESKREAIESRAGEAALWFVNAAPAVFNIPRASAIDLIRGGFFDNNPNANASLESPEVHTDLDLNDPVPIISLLNRQLVGQALDAEEVYEVMDSMDSVIIGDVDTCERKLRGFAEIGCDRLMCLMQMGALSHATVMKSIRNAGEYLIPRLAS